MIAYFRGAYDVLRAKDLEELDKEIQFTAMIASLKGLA